MCPCLYGGQTRQGGMNHVKHIPIIGTRNCPQPDGSVDFFSEERRVSYMGKKWLGISQLTYK